jgi:hypothetical protein
MLNLKGRVHRIGKRLTRVWGDATLLMMEGYATSSGSAPLILSPSFGKTGFTLLPTLVLDLEVFSFLGLVSRSIADYFHHAVVGVF